MYTGDVFGNVFFHRVPVSGVSALGEAEPVLLLGQELTTNETFKKSKLGQCESECPGQSKSQTDNRTIRNNAVVSMCSRSQDDGSILVAFKNGTIKQTGISRAKTSAFSGKVVLPFEPATECGGMQSLENGRYSVVLGQTSGIFGVIHDECWSGGTAPRIGQLSSEQGLATEVVLIGDARSTATSQREDSLFHVWAAGKGRTIRLIDEYSILWQATPHEPIHVTALAQVSNSPFLIAAATAKKKIVIYDIRKKGIQPDISVSTESLRGRPNKIRFFADCKCTVGDGLGELAVFDLRGKVTNHRNACLARLKAGNGAVVALDILHDAYAVAIFRDRYLRISKLSLPLHPITGNLVCERVQTVTPTALLTIPSLVQTDELCFLRRHVSSRELSVAQAGKRSNAETDPKGGNDRFSRAAHSISEKESNEMWSQLERVQGAFESTTSSLKNPELDNALTVSQRRRKKSVPSQGVTERKPQKRIR